MVVKTVKIYLFHKYLKCIYVLESESMVKKGSLAEPQWTYGLLLWESDIME